MSPLSRFRTLAVSLACLTLCASSARAALSDGPLRIEVITAYNLIVDSNIETPAGRGPTAAHLGVRIFNSGSTPLTNVRVRIGDLLNAATFSGTAGVYPVTTVPVGERLYSGSFSFTHQGGAADATRLVPLIPAGDSAVVYWLVSYPVKDASGVSVAGAGSDPSDDLRLDYDVWVEGYENGSTLRRAYDERRMFCRSELTAMANKIWPNTTSKVPDQYLDVFTEQLGWRPNATQARTVGADIIEGIWYDFGTVRQGFDNNGDLVPDYNAWMQPVGDPLAYDASSFRLVKTYGVVIIKLNDGTERIVPFEDRLYFENLPENNVGVVGLVYYEFVSLRQGAAGRLSPYQEVASGYDNEKFNGDYGAALASWDSRSINIVMDKNAPAVTNAGSSITYDMTARNTGGLAIGNPELGLPLVITDYVPSGLVYVANSATANNALPVGMTATVLYSTNGTSWVTAEPVPASSVVAVQWWLSSALQTNASVTVRFTATVPVSYPGVVAVNCASVSLAGNDPLARDCATTLIEGVNSVSGWVFEDDGSGGNFSNGFRDTADSQETGITGVKVSLYIDQNTNGVVDSSDLLAGTQDSAANGAYSFTKLPDGHYLVTVDPLDPQVTEFYALTTPALRAVDLDPTRQTASAVNVTDQNFGFAPPLSLDKSGGAVVYEGQEVTYRIELKNNLYSLGAESFTNLFWVPSNSIQRINLALTNAVMVSTNTGSLNPNWGIYVDRTRNRIYWCDQVLDRIWMDDLLATTTGGATTFLSGLTDPGYVAIDHKAPGGKQYMWWSASGKLQRADLGLASPMAEDRYTIISDVSCGIAIDEDSRWIYFVSKPTANGKYTIYRQSLDGAAGSRDTAWSVELNVSAIYDLDIDVASQRLYFVDRGVGVKFVTVTIATQSYATSFNVDNGRDVRGLAVDVPRDRVYFSDSANNQIDVNQLSTGTLVGSLATGTNPGDIDIEYGAGSGTFDVNTTIGTLKVVDVYPSNLLSFVKASIPPDSVTPAGTLTWNNLGPLNGGDMVDFTVTFKALAIPGNSPVNLTNAAAVTQALLVNGDPVNKPSDTAPTTILPSGSIAGRVWADTDADGWQPAQASPGTTFPSTGFETGELGIGGVRVVLQVDSNNDGVLNWAVTNRTDAQGYYLFPSLATNLRYRVVVDTTSLPGTGITATGDPDDDGVNAGNGATGSADSAWNNNAAGWFSLGVNTWRDASGTAQSWDVKNVNFGYSGTDPVVFGLVWLDLDRDGVRDAGEPGISGATVSLSGASSATLLTGADGTYTFRTNSAGSALSTGSYTVTITPPSGPTWIYTYESPTNAFGVVNGNTGVNGTLTFAVSNVAETSGSWDFGLIYEGARKIGDTVFFDTDRNGIQGPNEVGIAGVTMRLFLDTNGNGVLDTSDFLWATNVTDSSGTYLFTNLTSATYFVVANESDIPTGFRQTADPDQPGVVATLGDGMGVVGTGTNDVLTVDFGYAPQGAGRIGDRVFYDANLNGREDAGEGGISNVTVRLYLDRDGNGSYETLLASTQTDATGRYLFSDVVDGAYRAVVDVSDPDIPGTHTPSTSSAHTVTLSAGVTSLFDGFSTPTDRSLDADFGFAARPYVGDYVFFDANRNGTQDAGESGIPNVTLRLYTDPNGDGDTSDGVLVAVTNTASGLGANPAGYYQFANLVTGVYYVVRVDTNTLPFWNGAPIPLTADPDRDGVPVWDTLSYPGLPPGDHADSGILLGLMPYLGADFGYQPMGVIGDTVWRDLNANGIQDVGETGIPGVRVVATQGSTNVTAVTDGDGQYLFSNLADGAWTVYLAATNYTSGGALYGWTDTYDPDGGLNHSTAVVINNGSVSSANNAWTTKADASLDVDFGLRLNGAFTLSGTVLNDDAGSVGIYDQPALETELSGLFVYLYSSNNVLLGSTQTDTNGYYQFTYLPSGNYRVVLGTTVPPLDTARLTTTAAATGANALTNTGTSVIQDVTITGANRTGIDFAFVPTVFFDYGDLPAVYEATVLANDGARHAIPTNGASFYLGALAPDRDQDGQPSGFASGDDLLDAADDEDGAVPVNLGLWHDGASGGSVQVTVRAPAGRTAYLVGWIDFNQNGSLADPGELILSAEISGSGAPASGVYTFAIPSGTMSTTNRAWLARFRVFSEAPALPVFAYTGAAVDGEVEDHLFTENGAALGDRVWHDVNGNGVQDVGEAGVTNVAVRLYNGAGVEVSSTRTDTNGLYRFDNLPAGSYSVGFAAPQPYVFTAKDSAAATDSTDSDADPLTSRTPAVALLAGTTNLTLDAGLYVPALIYGYVFKDSNTNLVRDTGDGTITNALVRLVVNGVVVASTNTSSTGYYRFENIPVGSVSVLVSRVDATLVEVPVQPPASNNEMRNRARPKEVDAYIEYSVTSGYGVLETNPAEHLNSGFQTYPFSTAIDFRATADGKGGVVIDLWTVNESGYGDIVIYAWINNRWVEVGRVASAEVIGEGSNRYTIRSSNLPTSGSFHFRIVDEAGHVHDSPMPVAVSAIEVSAVRFEMETMVLTFSTSFGNYYVVRVSEELGAGEEGWAPEYVSVLQDGVWSPYSNEPFMAGEGTRTQVRVPVNRQKAFFRIMLAD